MAAKTSLEVYNTLKEKKDAIESEMTELLQVLETVSIIGNIVEVYLCPYTKTTR